MVSDGGAKGAWMHKLAVGLAVAISVGGFVVVAAIYSAPRYPEIPGEKAVEGPRRDYRPGGSGCDPKVLSKAGASKEALAERDRCAAAAEEQRQKQQEIVQATRAADMAERQTEIAYGQAKSAFVQTIATILAFGAAVMAALYARGAVREGKRSANFALESVELARKSFNTEYRPWIYPVVALTFPFAFDEKGIHTTLGIGMKNRGRLHALDVCARAWMFLSDGTGMLDNEHSDWATEFRNSRKKVGRELGKTVIPGEMESIYQGLRIWKSEIESSSVKIRDDAIIPILYVLITYRSPIDDILHHTYAVYHLFEVGTQTALVINPQKGDIPSKRISILQINTQAS